MLDMMQCFGFINGSWFKLGPDDERRDIRFGGFFSFDCNRVLVRW